MGLWTYSPNAFGDTYVWTDAKGQPFSATFDRLSRPRTRLELEGPSEWIWGATPALKNVGQLIETRNPSYKEQYQYQASSGIGAGRQTGITFTAESVAYQVDFEYHATQGLLEQVTYPQGTGSCRVKHQYGYRTGASLRHPDCLESIDEQTRHAARRRQQRRWNPPSASLCAG
ncbi:MAG: hypothetical protein EPO25_14665 [Gammaproteobacteria bacterium]|nr:MAG: hypothetical protein EPO25_14665 [Gammaproteobacteria bacterium]